jgi:hypothetical protein
VWSCHCTWGLADISWEVHLCYLNQHCE